jgi:hypothetical protein
MTFHQRLFSLVFFFAAVSIHAQQNVSGRWQGSFDVPGPNGAMQHDTAFLILQQNGTQVTGSAGQNEEKQTPLSDGLFKDGVLTFGLHVRGTTVQFNLNLEGDHLRGTATGLPPDPTAKAAINVARLLDATITSLRDQILAADRQLFDAYNTCNIVQFGRSLSADLEFYHDTTGVTGHDSIVNSLKQRCAEQTKYYRTLDEQSLQIFPVPGYGAMEIGTHRFYEKHPDGSEQLDASPGFANVWRQTPDGWKLTRVLSYGHR